MYHLAQAHLSDLYTLIYFNNSTFMSNRHFKLNTSKSELLIPTPLQSLSSSSISHLSKSQLQNPKPWFSPCSSFSPYISWNRYQQIPLSYLQLISLPPLLSINLHHLHLSDVCLLTVGLSATSHSSWYHLQHPAQFWATRILKCTHSYIYFSNELNAQETDRSEVELSLCHLLCDLGRVI